MLLKIKEKEALRLLQHALGVFIMLAHSCTCFSRLRFDVVSLMIDKQHIVRKAELQRKVQMCIKHTELNRTR